MRADGDGASLVGPIRQAIRRASVGHAPGAVQLMPERLKVATVRNQLAARVFGGFGVGALLLAAIGVYGTLALSVVQRTREFSIRRALGAGAESMLVIILRELLMIAGAGVLLGAVASVALNRTLSSLLYDVRGVEGASIW